MPADRWALSQRGREQAQTLARAPFWHDVRVLLSSDEPKALETAQPAAARHGLLLRGLPALREVRRPAGRLDDWEGTVREYLSGRPGPGGWEPYPDAARRAASAFDEILSAYPAGHLAVVSHGTLLTLYLSGLLALPDPFTFWATIPFAGWARLDPREPRLIRDFQAQPV